MEVQKKYLRRDTNESIRINKRVPSQRCNNIHFYNSGTTLFFINDIPVFPFQMHLRKNDDCNIFQDTEFELRFEFNGNPSNNCIVIREFLHQI